MIILIPAVTSVVMTHTKGDSHQSEA